MVLMGRVVDDGNVHSWLHNRQMHAPSSMVVGISVRCVAVLSVYPQILCVCVSQEYCIQWFDV